MTSTLVLAVVLLACVTLTLQKCFDFNCPHHEEQLQNCIQGDWLCQAGEFCEVQTHVGHTHGNSPYHIMACRPIAEMTDCVANFAHNVAACDPNKHENVCHWCCDTAACVQSLASGAFVSQVTVPPTAK